MKKTVMKMIDIYGWALSPFIGNNCRFLPTCSCYTKQAIEEFGVLKGAYVGMKRLCRCHPFTPGGFDPVPKE